MNSSLEKDKGYIERRDRVRETPLKERLKKCKEMIGKMCSEGRPPKMSIPLQWSDEDFFINQTISDAIEAIETTNRLQAEVRDDKKRNGQNHDK